MLSAQPIQTITQLLQHSATSFKDQPALSNIGQPPVTYQELAESVTSLVHQLMEHGVGFGDKVAILGENSPNWGIAYLAACTMGAVAVPILTEFHTDAVSHIIRHSEAKAVFVSEKLFPKVEDAEFSPAPTFINLETFLPISQGMSKATLKELKAAGMREFRKLKEIALRLANQQPRQEPTQDDLAAIIYTSGTTGHSKGVMLSHKNIISNAHTVSTIVNIAPGDRLLSILPLAHTFECTLGFITPLLHGAHVYYLDKPPTGRVLLPALAKVQPTVMLVVPLIMEKIYKNNILPKLTRNWLLRRLYAIPAIRKRLHLAAGKKLKELFGGKLWLMAIGGAPLATDAELFLKEAAFPYTIGYGLTESSPLLSGTVPALARLTSAGPPVSGVSIRIADINVLTGEGEIQAQGPNIMLGYYKAPEVTAETFTPDGWLKTGDLGYLDKDGYVYIKGRSKNMVLGPSGENIYPEEIESIFFTSPYVAEALVYQQAGRLVARVHLDSAVLDEVFSNLADDAAGDKRLEILEQIRQEVNSKVSSFAKIHKVYDQAEPFEKTPTHKIKRYLYVQD